MRGEEDLAELDSAQVATGDGCRSLSEWVAGSSRLGQRHHEDGGACRASATGPSRPPGAAWRRRGLPTRHNWWFSAGWWDRPRHTHKPTEHHLTNSVDSVARVVLRCSDAMVIQSQRKEVTGMFELLDVSALDMSIAASCRHAGPTA